MKICTIALLVALVVITLINIYEVWFLQIITYSIILLVMRKDLDQDHQHNEIKALKDEESKVIKMLKIDVDSLMIQRDNAEAAYDKLLKKTTRKIL